MALLGRIAHSLDRSTHKGRAARRVTLVCSVVCFAVMTLALSIQRGFEQSIKERIGLLGGDLLLEANRWTGSAPDSIAYAELYAIDGVRQAMAVEEQSVVAAVGATIRGAVVRRARPQDILGWLDGVWTERPEPQDWIADSGELPLAISATLARRLAVGVGGSVDLLVFSDSLALPQKTMARVAGIYSTSIETAEEPMIFAAATPQPTGYLLRGGAIDQELLEEVGAQYGWSVVGIEERAPELFDWLSMLQSNMVLVVVVILVVGLVNLAGGVLISILEGTSTIALLGALGLSQGKIRAMFLWRSLLVVSQGAGWGVGLGVAIAVVQHYGVVVRLNAADYFVDALPMAIVPWQWAWLAGGALVLIGMVVWAATYTIGRIRPASALTYE